MEDKCSLEENGENIPRAVMSFYLWLILLMYFFKYQRESLPIVKRELNILLEDSGIHGIPMMFIGNKIDI